MLIVGLTGGIGAGKSAVAELLRRRGATIIDTDEIARELMTPGSLLLGRVVREFGPEILLPDHSLNRAALARRIFTSRADRQRLNEISHPPIMAETFLRVERLRASEAPPAVVVVVAPLLFESGTEGRFDKIVVVTAEEQERIKRLQARDQLSEEEIRARFAAQIPSEKQVARADFVVDNSGDPTATEAQVEDLWRKLTARGK